MDEEVEIEMKGDVKVVGLVSGTHVLPDIGLDVPHGVVVTIPAEMAVRSTDLWRGISQRCLLQLQTSIAIPSYRVPKDPERIKLEERVRELEEHVAQLQAENAGLKGAAHGNAQLQAKLDSLLSMVQAGIPMVTYQAGSPAPQTSGRREEVADGSAPTFLPSKIKPEDVDVHMDIQGESSSGSVSTAAEKLRQLRKSKQ